MQSVPCEIITLDPFRKKGLEALNVRGIPGLEGVDFDELKTEYEDDTHFIRRTEAANLLQTQAPVPYTGELASVRLIFHFTHPCRTGMVELRPPHTLAFDSNCNPAIVSDWAAKTGFATHLQE